MLYTVPRTELIKHPQSIIPTIEGDYYISTTAIFTRSVSETHRITRLLNTLNIGTVSLQNDLSRQSRVVAFNKLNFKECHAIVATDVAAILCDPIPRVDRIIHFSLTWSVTAEAYTRRCVSNALGLDGDDDSRHAITFVTQHDVEIYLRLENALDVPMAEYAVDVDMVMACKGQVDEAVREDPSLRDTGTSA
ncbi:hypothetical protein B0T26DRAFT_672151 [Lasiosphaeria miniovina]|uniref:Helicase C-terminal domain-containing protein n=1 Tax=Lasiosphaeria miniovina TaxID=1954250 RepID=A0AA40B4I1_9PEZI|nr:uncharacterized protein B0T26DRAFT_672151 [Lasiosphaeria miniovina]KAK0727497.1 hypothetical protein B0T26DRAFT_672151 [Lasiosphaeria miniovina]